MDKRELILDSIKKLIALGVSDEEIVSNLADVGVDKKEALELTMEARSGSTAASSFGQPKIEEYVSIQSNAQPSYSRQISQPSQYGSSKEEGSKDVFDEITEQLTKSQQNLSQVSQGQSSAQQKNGSVENISGVEDEDDNEIEPSEIDTGIKIEEDAPETEESLDAQADSLNAEVNSAKNAVGAGTKGMGGSGNQTESEAEEESDALNALRKLSKSPQRQRQEKEDALKAASSRQVVRPLFSTAKSVEEKQEEAPTQEESENLIVNKIISEVASETSKKAGQKSVQQVEAKNLQKSFAQEIPVQEIKKVVPQRKPSSLDAVSDNDIEQLWKKGIVIAINAKLSEMKKLKSDVDAVVDQKVDAAVRKETEKFKILLDSQKELIISSNTEALEEKLREIAFIIDSKIAELRQYNNELKSNLVTLEKTRRERDDALAQLTAAIDEVRRTKVQVISESNSELIRIKSQTQEFIDAADAHLKEMDDRIAKTLELEKNIAEGMLQEAEQRIDELAIQKAEGLIQEMEVELNKIKAAEKQLSLDTLKQKIEILDEFKKQFLKNMEETLVRMNDSINALDQKNVDAERQIKERVLIFDAKIEGLEKFENEFAGYIQTLLGKK
ncbi:MAG: hypothetical protein NTZ73_03735 [Candidatus Diapherotrites archaeon]|nr:hypothetical protein [Candidatus Diapherotrites archaeon]